MEKVLIIGAGGVSNVATKKIARLTEIFKEITLASRTKSKCDAIAAEIDNCVINTARVDADNVNVDVDSDFAYDVDVDYETSNVVSEQHNVSADDSDNEEVVKEEVKEAAPAVEAPKKATTKKK